MSLQTNHILITHYHGVAAVHQHGDVRQHADVRVHHLPGAAQAGRQEPVQQSHLPVPLQPTQQ